MDSWGPCNDFWVKLPFLSAGVRSETAIVCSISWIIFVPAVFAGLEEVSHKFTMLLATIKCLSLLPCPDLFFPELPSHPCFQTHLLLEQQRMQVLMENCCGDKCSCALATRSEG